MYNFIPYLIFYGSYLVWLFLGFSLWILYQTIKIRTNKGKKMIAIVAILLSCIFIYARFIEPQLIIQRHTQIDTRIHGKLVVISDLHIGLYKSPKFLERVVSQINQLTGVNAVLVAGDFTNVYKKNEDFQKLFSSLSQIKVPVYAVLGNHDLGNPGPDFGNTLQLALKANHVQLLENESVTIPHTNFTLLGLGEHWSQDDEVGLLRNFRTENHLIVLTHNPDTVAMFPGHSELLTISGHTHGGQIRIPFLYKYMIPCEYDFDRGLSYFGKHQVFISSGLGETALPLRLFNPPVIDILEFVDTF